jgi:hypothetical protein
MKCLALLLLVPIAAHAAGPREDYVQQWPLQLSTAEAGAYRVTLSEAVYRGAQSPTLGDVQPLDADGQPLPASLLGPDAPLAGPLRRQALPLFQLPPMPPDASGDLQLIAERDAQGAVTRVETRLPADANAGHRQGGWLLDASALEAPLQALWLQWQDPPQLQAELRLEGSQDLRGWFVIDPQVTVVELDNGRQRLAQRRIALTAGARYLRLVPRAGALPELQSVQAEIAVPAAPLPWQTLRLDGKAVDGGFQFVSPGRFPVAQVDVVASGNQAVTWSVQSRDAADAPWIHRAGPWLAYQVGAEPQRSPPQALAQTSRDRYWRLLASAGSVEGLAPPQLQLGYRPEVLVFLAQGAPPYALAVGSARAHRQQAPLPAMIAALRQQRGAQWQPATATLGPNAQILAGEHALQPVAHDWKQLVLWALLVCGALAVGGFAFSLLRDRRATQTP